MAAPTAPVADRSSTAGAAGPKPGRRRRAQASALQLLLRTLSYTRPYLGWFALAAAFGAVFAAGRFGRAWLLKPLIDDALDERNFEILYQLSMIGAAIVVVMPIAQFARGYLSRYALGRTHLAIRCELAAKLLRLPLARHRAVNSGDTLTRTLIDRKSVV